MRKIFRMKYEPCNGRCYAWDDVVQLEQLADRPEELKRILQKMLKAHDPICGNENVSLGIDLDEENSLFVASFLHFGKLELFSDKNLVEVLHKLCDAVIEFYQTEDGLKETSYGLGHDVCEHGQDNDLLRFMVQHSGINTPNGIDQYLRDIRVI